MDETKAQTDILSHVEQKWAQKEKLSHFLYIQKHRTLVMYSEELALQFHHVTVYICYICTSASNTQFCFSFSNLFIFNIISIENSYLNQRK